jgi:hypothetical protein
MKHSTNLTICDGEQEIDVTVTYKISWGQAASYNEPADDTDIEIISVSFESRCADWQYPIYAAGYADTVYQDYFDDLVENAADEECAIRERMYENQMAWT